MTLIVGLQAVDGIVVCADSQETDGHYRRTRQKIEPKTCGHFEMAIAGSGPDGDAIDAAVHRLQMVAAAVPTPNLDALEVALQKEITKIKGASKQRLVGVARCIPTKTLRLWRIVARQFIPTPQYVFVGWEEALYERTIQRLYAETCTIPQCLIIGMSVLTLAEATSNYVKGPFSILVALPHGLYPDRIEHAQDLKDRVETFSLATDQVFISCADTSIGAEIFEQRLSSFIQTIRDLREDYIRAATLRLVQRGLNTINDPYPSIPLGSTIHIGSNDESSG